MSENQELSQIIDQIYRIRELEKELGLPKQFFENIKDEDDWSFVIKLHALIEASITNILTDKFLEHDFADIFSQMELSNKRTGEIAFIKKLNLLPKKFRNFISQFSELRNILVHEISNVEFNFKTYVDKLNNNKKKVLAEALAAGVTKTTCVNNATSYRFEQFAKDPKLCVWLSALCLISTITVQKDLCSIERSQQKNNAEFINSILNNEEQ